MATYSYMYDSPMYHQRHTASLATSAGGNGNYLRYVAFTDMVAKSVQVTVITAGTATTNTITVNKITGTTTTGITTVTVGTNTAGWTTNATLADTALLQGDQLVCRTGADATGINACTLEMTVKPGAPVTL